MPDVAARTAPSGVRMAGCGGRRLRRSPRARGESSPASRRHPVGIPTASGIERATERRRRHHPVL